MILRDPYMKIATVSDCIVASKHYNLVKEMAHVFLPCNVQSHLVNLILCRRVFVYVITVCVVRSICVTEGHYYDTLNIPHYKMLRIIIWQHSCIFLPLTCYLSRNHLTVSMCCLFSRKRRRRKTKLLRNSILTVS